MSKENTIREIIKNWIKFNRWSLFGLLALSSLSTVLYVSNVMTVNDLLKNIRDLEIQRTELIRKNDILTAKTHELQSADRITEIAEKYLGLVKSNEAPEILK
jgi:cell division protein FtsB